MRPHPLLPLVPLAALGCRQIEPAPKELDALLRWSFAEYEDAPDETWAEAIRNLDKAVGGGQVEHFDGTVTDLTREQVERTGITHADPSKAQGIFMVNPVACTLKQLTELVTARDQNGLYPGTYETFDREWTSDVEAFRAGREDWATWDESFSFDQLGIAYTADLEGGARRVPELDAEQSPFGPALINRRVMLRPADMEKDDHAYPQDWRVEIYYEREPGLVVHAAAMWRQADFGALNSDQEGTWRILLNGMKDWDDTSEKHCADM
jgi:hypothetical protein